MLGLTTDPAKHEQANKSFLSITHKHTHTHTHTHNTIYIYLPAHINVSVSGAWTRGIHIEAYARVALIAIHTATACDIEWHRDEIAAKQTNKHRTPMTTAPHTTLRASPDLNKLDVTTFFDHLACSTSVNALARASASSQTNGQATKPVISCPKQMPTGAVVRPRYMWMSDPQMQEATTFKITPC